MIIIIANVLLYHFFGLLLDFCLLMCFPRVAAIRNNIIVPKTRIIAFLILNLL